MRLSLAMVALKLFWLIARPLSSAFEARPLAGAGNGGNITSTSVNYLGYNALSTDLSPFSTGNFGTLTLNAPLEVPSESA